jgi:hypothetical protein
MRALVLYHPRSDHGGLVADYAEEFRRFKQKKLDLVSLESVEGADLAELYGVSVYPAVLVMRDDGSLLRLWQGGQLPLMDELSYYMPQEGPMLSHTGRTIATTVA